MDNRFRKEVFKTEEGQKEKVSDYIGDYIKVFGKRITNRDIENKADK